MPGHGCKYKNFPRASFARLPRQACRRPRVSHEDMPFASHCYGEAPKLFPRAVGIDTGRRAWLWGLKDHYRSSGFSGLASSCYGLLLAQRRNCCIRLTAVKIPLVFSVTIFYFELLGLLTTPSQDSAVLLRSFLRHTSLKPNGLPLFG